MIRIKRLPKIFTGSRKLKHVKFTQILLLVPMQTYLYELFDTNKLNVIGYQMFNIKTIPYRRWIDRNGYTYIKAENEVYEHHSPILTYQEVSLKLIELGL